MATEIQQSMTQAVEVMHSVGEWMVQQGLHADYWLPENMTVDEMRKHAGPNEFYAVLKYGIPAASVVLQDNERNQSWEFVDGKTPQKALYIHWLAVKRKFAGEGLSHTLVEFAEQEARRRHISRLRLDTDANEPKLVELYTRLGFTLRDVEEGEKHSTAYFEKILE